MAEIDVSVRSPVAAARKLLGRMVRFAAALPLPTPARGWCCICEAPVGRFLPYTSTGVLPYRLPPLMQELEVVGSDLRRFTCPRCLSHDRERHLLLYLRATGLAQRLQAMRILHFAPEPNLTRLIAQQHPARYVRADLFPADPSMERINLQQIPYPDGSFDLLLANHVLEHVGDHQQALREIVRVLAPGGHAILQTPYSPVLRTTFSDPGIRSPQARLQAFGQEDHVRLYGTDIFERFASAGLLDRCVRHADALAGIDAFRHGVNPSEPLFLFQKPDAAGRH